MDDVAKKFENRYLPAFLKKADPKKKGLFTEDFAIYLRKVEAALWTNSLQPLRLAAECLGKYLCQVAVADNQSFAALMLRNASEAFGALHTAVTVAPPQVQLAASPGDQGL